MLDRFDGADGKRRLADLLSRQMVLAGSASVVESLVNLVAVRAVPDRDALIKQEASDCLLYTSPSPRD